MKQITSDPLADFDTGISQEPQFKVLGFADTNPIEQPQMNAETSSQLPSELGAQEEQEFKVIGKVEPKEDTWGKWAARNALTLGKSATKRLAELPSNVVSLSKMYTSSLRPSEDDIEKLLNVVEASGLKTDRKALEKNFKAIRESKEDSASGGPLGEVLDYVQEKGLMRAGEKVEGGFQTISDVFGLGPLKAEGTAAKFLNASAKDIASYGLPALAGFAFGGPVGAAIGIGGATGLISQAVVPNVGIYAARALDAPKSVQRGIKTALQVGMGIFNAYKSFTPKMAADTEYAAMEAQLPKIKNAKASTNNLSRAFEKIERTLNAPGKSNTDLSLIKHGMKEFEYLADAPLENINELLLTKNKLNNVLRGGVKDKYAAKLIRDFKDAAYKDIFNFGKESTEIPAKAFIRSFKAADDLTRDMHKTAIGLKFLNNNKKALGGAVIGGVTSALLGTVASALESGEGAGPQRGLRQASLFALLAPLGIGGLRGINFLLKGPAVQGHYLKVISAAAKQNLPLALSYIKRLDKEITKKVGKDINKPVGVS